MSDPRDFFHHLTPRELESVRRCLLPGEEIYWGTRPVARFRHGENCLLSVFLMAFASIFAYAALHGEWEPGTTSGGAVVGDVLFMLFAFVVGGLGAALFLSPFFHHYRLRHTLYIITNRRALVVAPGRSRTQAFELDDYMLRWRRVQKDAQGDLVFHEEGGRESFSGVGFLNLPDVQLAERMLNEALAARQQHSQSFPQKLRGAADLPQC